MDDAPSPPQSSDASKYSQLPLNWKCLLSNVVKNIPAATVHSSKQFRSFVFHFDFSSHVLKMRTVTNCFDNSSNRVLEELETTFCFDNDNMKKYTFKFVFVRSKQKPIQCS